MSLKYLNKRSEQYHKILALANKPLVMLCSEKFDNVVLTQEAYVHVKSLMDTADLRTHIRTAIMPCSAAALGLNVLTFEDVQSL